MTEVCLWVILALDSHIGPRADMATPVIAPDKDWRQLGIYPPLFGLIGYFKF